MHTGRLSQASWSMIDLRTAGVRERLAPHDIALGHRAETDIHLSVVRFVLRLYVSLINACVCDVLAARGSQASPTLPSLSTCAHSARSRHVSTASLVVAWLRLRDFGVKNPTHIHTQLNKEYI